MSELNKKNEGQKDFRYFALCSLMLFLAGFFIYYPTLFYDFVFDDHSFIVLNPFLRSFDHFLNSFSTGFPLNRLMSLWSFGLNYKIYGFNPYGYHLFNLLVHIASTFAVWWLARSLLTQASAFRCGVLTPENKIRLHWAAFFVALFFCVHPVQVQAVAYITQRFSSLATLFYVLSLCFYIQGRLTGGLKHSWGSFLLSVLSALMAITSKEEAVSLPFMILAIELCFFSKPKEILSRQTSFKIAIGLVVFFAVFVKLFNSNLVTILRSTISSESHEGDIFNLGTYILTQIKVFVTFLRLLVYPFPQTFDYDYPMAHSIFEPGILVRCVLIVLMVFVAIKLRKKMPLASFGIVWFFIAFSANLVPRANVIWEHKLYLISFGFFLFLVVLLNGFIRSFRILCCVLIMLALFWSWSAAMRHQVFKDDLSLWKDSVAHSPDKWRPVCNLANAYYERGDLDKAESLFKQGVLLSRSNPIPMINLAGFYFNRQMYEKAGELYEQVIRLGSSSVDVRIRLGECFEKRRNYVGALCIYRTAYVMSSNDPSLVHRAKAYTKIKAFKKAEQLFRVVLKHAPSDLEALTGMAQLYQAKGDRLQALGFYDQAVALNPDREEAYLERGLFLYSKDKSRAKADVSKAYEINPYNMKVSAVFHFLKF